MLYFKNKILNFDQNRCTQCGVCLAACPEDALDVALDVKTGLSAITPNQNCIKCGKCAACCPAVILPEKRVPAGFRPLRSFVSRCKDEKTRQKASSGGAVRSIVEQALASGLVRQAYLLLSDEAYPWARGALVEGRLDLDSVANSRYLPILAMRNLNKADGGESILLVGTACQLYGARRLLEPSYGAVYSITIFCKQQKRLALSRHFARRLGERFDINGPPMQYRGDGWPGRVGYNGKSLPYARLASLPYGQKLWRVPGCRCCPDPFCLESDLAVADPWTLESAGPGNSLVMVLSDGGGRLLENASGRLISADLSEREMRVSVDYASVEKKARLTSYYAGKKCDRRVRLAGLLEKWQIRLLEMLVENLPLPTVGYKLLSRLPKLSDYLLGPLPARESDR